MRQRRAKRRSPLGMKTMLEAVALGEDAAADGRTLGVVGEVCGVPEDFPRLMADVVCAAEYAAEFLLVLRGTAARVS